MIFSKKSAHLVLLCLLFSACGKKEGAAPALVNDYGLSKVKDLEGQLANNYNYTFKGDKSDSLANICNESFVEKSFSYLQVAQNYLDEVVAVNAYKGSTPKSVQSNYNLLLDELKVLFSKWTGQCQKTQDFKMKIEDYSPFKFKLILNTKKDAGSLIHSLSEQRPYKKALEDVLFSMKNGLPFLRDDVVTLHLYQQVLFFKKKRVKKKDIDKLKKRLWLILSRVDTKVDSKKLGDFKKEYEKQLMEILNVPIIYNSRDSSVGSKVFKGKTQCLSGTKTDLLLNLLQKRKSYYNLRPVVITQKGHTLPGFIYGDEGNWHLYGVETTLGGKALNYFGNIANLKELEKTTLVYDAFDYLQLDAVQYYISNSEEMVKEAFMKIAKRYLILDAETLFEAAIEMDKGASREIGGAFAIGRAEASEEDEVMEVVESFSSVRGGDFISTDSIGAEIMSAKKGLVSNMISQYQKRLQQFDQVFFPGDFSGGVVSFENEEKLSTMDTFLLIEKMSLAAKQIEARCEVREFVLIKYESFKCKKSLVKLKKQCSFFEKKIILSSENRRSLLFGYGNEFFSYFSSFCLPLRKIKEKRLPSNIEELSDEYIKNTQRKSRG